MSEITPFEIDHEAKFELFWIEARGKRVENRAAFFPTREARSAFIKDLKQKENFLGICQSLAQIRSGEFPE